LTIADSSGEATEHEAKRNADHRRDAEADADALQRGESTFQPMP
jgi:hypothetical protein